MGTTLSEYTKDLETREIRSYELEHLKTVFLPEECELYTEGELWKPSGLGLINAVLDTLIPGLRLTLKYNADENGNIMGSSTGYSLRVLNNPSSRPRAISRSLWDLVISIKKSLASIELANLQKEKKKIEDEEEKIDERTTSNTNSE